MAGPGTPADLAGRRPCRGRATTLGLLLGIGLLLVAGCGGDDGQAGTGTATIAFLRATATPQESNLQAFFEELAGAGLEPGRGLELIDEDSTVAYPDPEEAASRVRSWAERGVDVIVALSTTSARVAADTAPTTNVVFLSNDPRATGLVRDERRPERNLTGATFRVPADRTLDLVRRAVPDLDRLGYLIPPEDPAAAPAQLAVVEAARALRLDLRVAEFTADRAAEAVEELLAADVDGILLSNTPTTVRALADIEDQLRRSGVPVFANTSVATDAMLVLEPDTEQLYRQMARQTLRLLRGTPVARVPVEDPARFRVIVDRAAARRVGIELPQSILDDADVVED